jgi:ectoine hydroxylase-related dioxygenase (phytanoyl-CoA dioxygenase family)
VSGNLNAAQIDQYNSKGYLCPVPVLNSEEAQTYRQALEGIEDAQGHSMDRMQSNKSYLLFDWADELVHNPKIVDAVESLIGPNIICYMTNLFTKEAGSNSYVSMHQDAAYWGVDASDVVTVWLALSPASKDSGVMKVQPGSHTTILEQVNTYAKDNLLTRGQEIPSEHLNPENHVYMELEPGEASLHHFKLVHGSDANTTDDRRIGFAIRYVNASARQIGLTESALLVRGENKSNFILEKRAKGNSEKARLKEHARALRRQIRNVLSPGPDAKLTERMRLAVTRTAGIGLSYWRELTA